MRCISLLHMPTLRSHGACIKGLHQPAWDTFVCVWAAQATSNVEFVLPMAAVTAGIVSALQFSADLTFAPWLKVDYLSNRCGASASDAGVSGVVW
jgi:hypothetical protein